MKHLSEEQFILHFYGEEGDGAAAGRHLSGCAECRARYGALERVLRAVDLPPAPARGAAYGGEVWRRIEHRLPAPRPARSWAPPWLWAGAAAALASLLVGAFLAGRWYQPARPPAQTASADAQVRQRILLVAVGDYLERSQTVLIELTTDNRGGPLDISSERARAAELVTENRLYRQTAEHIGDTALAGVLEELERVLVDISHSASPISHAEMERLRERLEGQGILVKIRVLGSKVKNQNETPRPPGPPAAVRKS